MAREWSRRSIEEIARKIGKGLGGGWTGFAGSSGGGGIYTDILRPIRFDDNAITVKAYYDPNLDLFLGYLDSAVLAYHSRSNASVWIEGPYSPYNRGVFKPFVNSVIPREKHKTIITNGYSPESSNYREVKLSDYTEEELTFQIFSVPVSTNSSILPSVKISALTAYGTKALNVLNYLGNNDITPIYIIYPLGE